MLLRKWHLFLTAQFAAEFVPPDDVTAPLLVVAAEIAAVNYRVVHSAARPEIARFYTAAKLAQV